MLKSQFNPFRFFTDKKARQWDKTPDNEESRVFYEVGKIPAFTVLIDSGENDPAPSVSAKLYDANDVKLHDLSGFSTSSQATYKQILYSGEFLNGEYNNDVYIQLTIDGTVYYSDVFAWSDRVDEQLKVKVLSSGVSMNYAKVNLLYLTSEFYLNYENTVIRPKITQQGEENRAVTNVVFGSRAIERELEIHGTDAIFIYLSALGLLQTNGVVEFTYDYETFTATEFTVEEKTNHGDGLYQLKLSFVDVSETVSVLNE